MLPVSYQIPAAIVLLLSGTVACFFGYRLFRIVLAISGFILGAFAASSLMGVSETTSMVVAAAIGGGLGAALLFGAYLIGVALVGAGLGATAANLVFSIGERDPHALVIVFLAIAGAAGATYFRRYFLIVGTAFGGAWTMIIGAVVMVGDRAALEASAADNIWVLYPLEPLPGFGWMPIAWFVLGLIGVGVQMGLTGGERGRVGLRKRK